ncbi:MAG: DUF5666 domain-containing protein [Candidatus Pacebacteria bacterium]|nr:DUF5666 domain-containing protein [Candidatus Paceibacterota bacterium]
MKRNINKISAGIAIAGFFVIATVAYAQTAATAKTFMEHGSRTPSVRPITGTVSATNGSTSLTMTVQASSTAAVTTYTVNTSNARVMKDGTTTPVTSIQINDKIAVVGTVSGMNITAKVIFDGVIPHTTGPPAGNRGGHAGSTTGRSFASSTRPFVKPAAFGSVSSITSGSSFTLAQRSMTGTTTLTIDTDSSTTFREGTTTAGFSNLAIGNLVAVTGTTTAVGEIQASKVMIIPQGSFGKGEKGNGISGRKGWSKGSAASTPQ